ncbi:MAG: hypothetical protein KAQ63_01405 [Candidatus Moranbacteria bacterium]|nr:hypothetical protein [Candidatus Moranbacteria bacterium]
MVNLAWKGAVRGRYLVIASIGLFFVWCVYKVYKIYEWMKAGSLWNKIKCFLPVIVLAGLTLFIIN